MGRPEIIDKLNSFLNEHLPFTEECEIVYFLVEIRKILDRENNKKYPILRFYCNWCVHTDKDSTKEMKSIMETIYSDIFNQITNPATMTGKKPAIIGFMYMEYMQAEMQNFLQEYSLPNALVMEKENRLSLVTLLVRILADQPIKNPCKEVIEFSFTPADPGCVRGKIIFTDEIDGHPSYHFGNAY